MYTTHFCKNLDHAFSILPKVVEGNFKALLSMQTGDTYAHVLRHQKEGDVMVVRKEVTDDLLMSVLPHVDLAKIDWPSRVLKMVFQDPSLPSVLLSFNTSVPTITKKITEDFESIRDLLGRHVTTPYSEYAELEGGKPFLILTMLTKDNKIVMQQTAQQGFIDFYAEKDGDYDISKEADLESTLHAEYLPLAYSMDSEMHSMLALCLKVILFCGSEGSLPTVTPKVINTYKGTGRNKKVFRAKKFNEFVVHYLPRHKEEREEQKTEALRVKGRREFRGRYGYYVTYRSDRYVNVQGTTRYMYPIPDPVTGLFKRRKFVVMKPR
jgi:hypothetical protein